MVAVGDRGDMVALGCLRRWVCGHCSHLLPLIFVGGHCLSWSLWAVMVICCVGGRCQSSCVLMVVEVFTLPHEFRRIPLDSKRNVGIPWNSDRIHLARASAILVFHSMEFPTESDRIQWNQLESGSLQEWFPLESIGMCWNPLECVGIHWNSTEIWNSNGFKCLPLLLL